MEKDDENEIPVRSQLDGTTDDFRETLENSEPAIPVSKNGHIAENCEMDKDDEKGIAIRNHLQGITNEFCKTLAYSEPATLVNEHGCLAEVPVAIFLHVQPDLDTFEFWICDIDLCCKVFYTKPLFERHLRDGLDGLNEHAGGRLQSHPCCQATTRDAIVRECLDRCHHAGFNVWSTTEGLRVFVPTHPCLRDQWAVRDAARWLTERVRRGPFRREDDDDGADLPEPETLISRFNVLSALGLPEFADDQIAGENGTMDGPLARALVRKAGRFAEAGKEAEWRELLDGLADCLEPRYRYWLDVARPNATGESEGEGEGEDDAQQEDGEVAVDRSDDRATSAGTGSMPGVPPGGAQLGGGSRGMPKFGFFDDPDRD